MERERERERERDERSDKGSMSVESRIECAAGSSATGSCCLGKQAQSNGSRAAAVEPVVIVACAVVQ